MLLNAFHTFVYLYLKVCFVNNLIYSFNNIRNCGTRVCRIAFNTVALSLIQKKHMCISVIRKNFNVHVVFKDAEMIVLKSNIIK